MKVVSRCPRGLLTLLCLASLTHLGLWIYGQNSPEIRKTADSAEYTRAATNLLKNGTFYSGRQVSDQNPAHFSRRPPLYPLLIASLRTVHKDPGLIVLAQVLLNFLGAYLLWKILGTLEVRRPLQLALVAFYLFYPTQLIYSHFVMAEILLQLMLLSSFFFFIRFHKTRRWHHLALCNLLLGLAALTKPVLVYFWFPNLLFQAWLLWRTGKQKYLVLALLPLFFVTLWSYRNYVHTGYFHFSSIKNSNMLHVNIRGLVRSAEGMQASITATRDLQQQVRQTDSFAEASNTIERAFFETAFANWKMLPFIYARGSLFFFLDPGRFDLYEFLDLSHNFRSYAFLKGGIRNFVDRLGELPPFVSFYLLFVGTLNLFLLAGFTYFSLSRRYPVEIKGFVLILVGYVLLIVAPTGLSRFRLCIVPFLLVALAPLLERLLVLIERRIR